MSVLLGILLGFCALIVWVSMAGLTNRALTGKEKIIGWTLWWILLPIALLFILYWTFEGEEI